MVNWCLDLYVSLQINLLLVGKYGVIIIEKLGVEISKYNELLSTMINFVFGLFNVVFSIDYCEAGVIHQVIMRTQMNDSGSSDMRTCPVILAAQHLPSNSYFHLKIPAASDLTHIFATFVSVFLPKFVRRMFNFTHRCMTFDQFLDDIIQFLPSTAWLEDICNLLQ